MKRFTAFVIQHWKRLADMGILLSGVTMIGVGLWWLAPWVAMVGVGSLLVSATVLAKRGAL